MSADPNPAAVEPTVSKFSFGLSTESPLVSDLTPTNSPPPGPGGLADYELLRELGRGGMGVVYEARDEKSGARVAVKMIRSDGPVEMAEVIRFLAEADTQAHIDHPHVARVLKIGESAGQPYMVLEYLGGGTLAGRLRESPRMSPTAAARLVAKVARGVHAAHQKGVFHRDLKPANVLFDEHGEPRVADFGLAKRDLSDLTRTGTLMGTPAYMAPEQAQGRAERVAAPTDVWALGVILYEAVTGGRPFAAPANLPTEQQVMALLNKVVTEPPPPPRSVLPDVPHDLEKVCLKCLEKEPADRYPTAAALADDLDRFAAGKPVGVRTISWVERGAKWARRRPTAAAAWAVSAVAVVLGAFAVTALSLWQRAEGERATADTERAGAVAARQEAETARDALAGSNKELESARQTAVAAGDRLAVEKKETEKARDALAAAQDRLARVEYARTIDLAFQELRELNLPRARGLLASTRADLRGWEFEFVSRAIDRRQLVLAGHPDSVEAVAFGPDGTRVASACNIWKDVNDVDGPGGVPGPGRRAVGFEVRVWDAATGRELFALKGPDKSHLGSVEFAPDGKTLLTAGDAARVWNLDTRAVTQTIPAARAPARFAADGRRVVAPKKDAGTEVGVWNAATGKELAALRGHTGTVHGVAVSPDGSRVATTADTGREPGSRDSWGELKVWDAATLQPTFTAPLRSFGVREVAFSPDGKRVAAPRSPADGTSPTHVQVWDAATGFEVAKVPVPNSPWGVAFDRGGTRLAVACGYLLVADPATGKVLNQFRQQHASHVAFAPAGPDRLASGGSDKVVKLWALGDAESRTLAGAGTPREFNRLAFTPDGSKLVAAGDGGRVWDAATGRPLAEFKPGGTTALAVSPDGATAATFKWNNTVTVWDVATGAERLKPDGQGGAGSSVSVRRLAFSPDGKALASPTFIDGLRVWDAATGRPRGPKAWHRSGACCAYHPSGSPLAVTDFGTVHLLDPATGKGLGTLAPPGDAYVVELVYSPDGGRLAAGTGGGDVVLWSLGGPPKPPAVIRAHTGAVAAVAFSPDSSRLVSAGETDGRVVVWDPESGEGVLTIHRDPDAVHDVAFGKGGRLAAVCGGGTVRVWSLDR